MKLPRPSADGLGTVEEFPEGLLKIFSIPCSNDQWRSFRFDDFVSMQQTEQLQQVSIVCSLIFETDFYTMGTNPDGLNINWGRFYASRNV